MRIRRFKNKTSTWGTEKNWKFLLLQKKVELFLGNLRFIWEKNNYKKLKKSVEKLQKLMIFWE
jgi:hypothetical protein